MLNQKPLNKILFVDVETTSQKPDFSSLSDHQKTIFKKRFKKEFESRYNQLSQVKLLEESSKKQVGKTAKQVNVKKILEEVELDVLEGLYNEKAPIFPEFGRILCISVGVLWQNSGEDFFNVKITSFFDEDEKVLLSEFIGHEKLKIIFDELPGKYEKNVENFWGLCAHNGKTFDFPFIVKRLIINGFQIPAMFDYAGLKPWEQTHIIDTKEEWKFGVWDSSTSLDSLCEVFNIPTSKSNMKGEEVKDAFWIYKSLSSIKDYCEEDVYALVQVYLKMKSIHSEVRLYKPLIEQPIAVNQNQHVEKVDSADNSETKEEPQGQEDGLETSENSEV